MEKINLAHYPSSPGVYFFRDRRGRILYIGKAANLRARLRSYFAKRVQLEPAKRQMLTELKSIKYKVLSSPIKALILEAQLIKQHQPKYNVLLRDDKQYFYVGFTREDFPRVFLTHQPLTSHMPYAVSRMQDKRHKAYGLRPTADYVGPFTEGGAIKKVLKLLRRIFPYATHKGFPRHCLAYDLGLCPLPKRIPENNRAQAELKRTYRKNILHLCAVLEGRGARLVAKLKGEMRDAAKLEQFERAGKLRDQITALENIFEHKDVLANREALPVRSRDSRGESRGLKPEQAGQIANRTSLTKDLPKSLREILPRSWPWRIDGYDISNLQGTAATASMVIFIGAKPAKEWYRKFKIKTVHGANDVAMLKEVISRRLAHKEWPTPDLMLIDGGKPQLNAAIAALGEKPTHYSLLTTHSPLVLALAKRREEIYMKNRKTPIRLPGHHPFRLLLMHVRDEAHRFAKAYHTKRRHMMMIPKKK